MPQARRDADTPWAAHEQRRVRNLRQLLLRASRAVNRQVVAGLRARGYAALRATHTTLLSNLDLAGSTITAAAERAGISKQAMGRLATELQAAGYIRLEGDLADARAKVLRLTADGERLMLDSLEVMAQLEEGYAALLGNARFAGLRKGLETFVATCE